MQSFVSLLLIFKSFDVQTRKANIVTSILIIVPTSSSVMRLITTKIAVVNYGYIKVVEKLHAIVSLY